MENYSMLDVAIEILRENGKQMDVKELINKVLEKLGIEDVDYKYSTQLYLDMTTSAKFVYEDSECDLKERRPLKDYDKDGSEFEQANDFDEELDNDSLDTDDDQEEDLDDDYDDEDSDYYDDDDSYYSDSDDYDDEYVDKFANEASDFDENEYLDMMDEYEDRYDDK